MFSRILLLLGLSGLIMGCESTSSSAQNAGIVAAAISDSTRLNEAVIRDENRKPAEVLAFAGTEPGDKILDIAPAGGYYTALLSRVVGDDGKIYAVDPERIFKFFPQGREGFPKYIEQDPRDNVEYSVQNLDQLSLPEKVDQIWIVLYYHDTLWTGEDRAEMNQRFFDALNPGGSMILIDHHALKGTGEEVGRTLHRMDSNIARRELTAAGFVIEEESMLLSNGADPRNDSVFGEARRGNTDRFLWRLRKPG